MIDEDISYLEYLLDENIIGLSKFFLLYLLTASFVTQAANLVDVPHWMYLRTVRKSLRQ